MKVLNFIHLISLVYHLDTIVNNAHSGLLLYEQWDSVALDLGQQVNKKPIKSPALIHFALNIQKRRYLRYII